METLRIIGRFLLIYGTVFAATVLVLWCLTGM